MAERSFARHETFHPRYGWFRTACAEDGSVFNREDTPVQIGVGKKHGVGTLGTGPTDDTRGCRNETAPEA